MAHDPGLAVAPRAQDISVTAATDELEAIPFTPPPTQELIAVPIQPELEAVPAEPELEAVPIDIPSFVSPQETEQGRFLSGINSIFKGAGSGVGQALKGLGIASDIRGVKLFGRADPVSPEGDPLFEFGKDIAEATEEIFPTNPKFQDEFLTKLLSGAGQLGTTISVGLLTGGLGAALQASSALAAGEYERAKASGSSEEEAFNVFLLNLPVGALDAIPVARLFRRLDRVTGGGVKKVLAQGFAGTLSEGIQEAGQEALTNVVAGQTYDATRKIMDGVLEAGLIGGILGGVATGVSVGVKTAVVNARDKAELADAFEAAKYVDDTVNAVGEGGSDVHAQSTALANRDLPSTTTATPDQSAIDISEDQGLGTLRQKIFGWLLGPEQKLPTSLKRENIRREALLSKEVVEVDGNVQKFLLAVRKQYLGVDKAKATKRFFLSKEFNEIPNEVWTLADAILKGEINRLPTDSTILNEDALKAIFDMRNHIDRLSNIAIKEGLVEGDLKGAFERNLGFYIHRFYRKDTVKNWADKVDPEIRLEAFDHIDKEYRKAGNPLTNLQINNIIADILRGPDSEFQARTGRIGTIDTAPLHRRDNTLSPEIRALMGEYTDVLSNYIKSVQMVSGVVHNGNFLKRLATRYKNIYFYEDGEHPLAFSHKISAPNNQSMGALAGMRTHKDIFDAFNEVYIPADRANWLTWWVRMNSIAKYGKTVLNPVTQARNLYGGVFFLMSSGIVPKGKHFKAGFEAAKSVALGRTPVEFQAAMEEYASRRLDVEGARAGELNDVLSFFETDNNLPFDSSFENFLTPGRQLENKARKVGRKVLYYGAEISSNLYRATDVGLRIVMYESVLAQRMDAYSAELESGARTLESVKDEAARIALATYQDYSQVPSRIRALSKFPLIGAFVSFPSEVVRLTFNGVEQARKDLNSDNVKIRKAGRNRLIGIFAAMASSGAAAAMSRMLQGMDDREDEDIKRFVAPWDKNSELIYLNNRGTKRRYLNPSYYNPWGLLTDPITAFIQGEPDGTVLDRYINAAQTFFLDFFGEEIMTQKVLEANANKRAGGARIYNPEDSVGERANDLFWHFVDGIEPGIFTSARRTYSALDGTITKSGEKRDLGEEAAALFGFRSVDLDIPRSLGFRARDFSRRARDSKAIYNSALRDPNADPDEVADALDRANIAYEAAFDDALLDVEAAARLGVGYREIEKIMRDGGVSLDRIKQLRSRRPKRIRPEIRR